LTTLIVDTSVLIKWFHSEGESELDAARAIRDAVQRGDLDALVLDLATYELGNVLLRALGWAAADIADQLDDVLAVCGTAMVMPSAWVRDAALLGERYQLTFYDAAWAACARGLSVPLVSADARLLDAGLAESATAFARRLMLL
jgi:predicted nucleic acid-binding protein